MKDGNKVFVRYNNFDQGPPPPRPRNNDKRPYEKKKYAEKHTRTRQAFKVIYDSFQPINSVPPLIEKLLKTYPKFFNRESKVLEKENPELLNDYLILFPRKFFEGLKEPKKDTQQMMSSSDPDWNSDDDVDGDMESKAIDQAIIEKTVEKMKDKPYSRPDKLKPHQKKFLQDYFKQKRQREQEEGGTETSEPAPQKKQTKKQKIAPPPPAPPAHEPQKAFSIFGSSKNEQDKPKLDWSDYQERQLNTFVDMGFMTKVEENEEDLGIEVIEDDDMFNKSQSEKDGSSDKNSSEEQDEQDDIFGDEGPTTTVKTKKEPEAPKVEAEKKTTQGTVLINENLFSRIAQSIGLMPSRCNWIIRSDVHKYKVTTEYMDAYYRKEKMFQMLPLISLNHSQFVSNDKVETPEGIAVLRDFNYRKQNKYQYRPKYNYKQKNHTHLKKK